MEKLDSFYLNQSEPIRSCLLALRDIILYQDKGITAELKYGMPFFCYRGKMLCYLWIHKKHKNPYLGLVDGNQINHPNLIQEKRARMKIMLFDPKADLPIELLSRILIQAITIIKNRQA
jgi:hypothetical protein